MEKLKEQINGPIFFERNRVFRVYKGGKLFADFFDNDDPVDSNLPEEWVSSTVTAMNKDSTSPHEGLSVIRGTDVTLRSLIEAYPDEMVGKAGKLEVLVKVLDSAVRLPVQAHPDKAYSRKYFNSDHGKAECWIVLATRENAKLYFGFKDKVTKEEFSHAVEESRTNKTIMAGFLNEVDAKPGDIYFIPANFVHAIGYGCLILEVQEPTDFTVQPERLCGDYVLSDYEMYLTLDRDIAMDVFRYDQYGRETVELARKQPVLLSDSGGVRREQLIGEKDTDCFAVNRYILSGGSMKLTEAPSVCVVVDGLGMARVDGANYPLRKGDYFFLPRIVSGRCEISGQCTLLECLPPKE